MIPVLFDECVAKIAMYDASLRRLNRYIIIITTVSVPNPIQKIYICSLILSDRRHLYMYASA